MYIRWKSHPTDSKKNGTCEHVDALAGTPALAFGYAETAVAAQPVLEVFWTVVQSELSGEVTLYGRCSRKFGHDLDDWFKAEMDMLHPVHVKIAESGDKLEVKAEVPGFNENEIEVSVEPNRLTISGKRETETTKEEKGKTVYTEFCSNRILRIVDLPARVDVDKTIATLKNGILQLTMAKAVKAKAIEIKPKAA